MLHAERVDDGCMTERTDRSSTPQWHRKRRDGRAAPIRVARDLLTVRRVFGEPVQHGDVTLVPVARVFGGSGYGGGEGSARESDADRTATGSGSGGGFGVAVSPVGVYVVEGSSVTWQPAFDLNRVILGGQLVGAIALLVLARALRRRRLHRPHGWRSRG